MSQKKQVVVKYKNFNLKDSGSTKDETGKADPARQATNHSSFIVNSSPFPIGKVIE